MLSAARRIYRHSWFCYSFVFRFDWNVYLRDMWLARNICMTMLFFFCCVACFGVCSTAGCCLSRQLASGWLSYMFCYFFFALGHDICVNAIPDGNVALPSLVFFNATSTSTRTRRVFFTQSSTHAFDPLSRWSQLQIEYIYVVCCLSLVVVRVSVCALHYRCNNRSLSSQFQASSLRVAFSASASNVGAVRYYLRAARNAFGLTLFCVSRLMVLFWECILCVEAAAELHEKLKVG